jgi:hypothetical protein
MQVSAQATEAHGQMQTVCNLMILKRSQPVSRLPAFGACVPNIRADEETVYLEPTYP